MRYDRTSTRDIEGAASFSSSRRLAAKFGRHRRRPGDVALGSGDIANEANTDWIAQWEHDNRDSLSCLLCGESSRRGCHGNNICLEAQTFGGDFCEPVIAALR